MSQAKLPAPEVSIVWFKRDLRIEDHEPLVRAARAGRVLPLFVYEPELYDQPDFDPCHFEFQRQCLEDLAERLEALGAPLVTRVGRIPEVFEELYQEQPFGRILSHQETGNGVTYARDLRVQAWCRERGVEWRESLQHGVFRRLQGRDGWAARWTRVMQRPVLAAPGQLNGLACASSGIRTGRDLGVAATGKTQAWTGGEQRAHDVLESFLEERGERYQFEMSSPVTADRSCSRLSPYLAYGAISMRSVVQATNERRRRLKQQREDGIDIGPDWLRSLHSFDKRLRWNSHFMQKLEDEPRIEFENMARAYDGLREEAFDQERFDAWASGHTGYPLVDACMRCLQETGWIGFRMRAMLMSFASYHLWLHWRPTALHLARLFVDFEPGIHYSQAQMQSGVTGINSLRIYSPTKQVRDHDPEGRFIRRWVPELEPVPNEFIAEPWKLPRRQQMRLGCSIRRDYPPPLIDERAAAKEARSRLMSVRGRKESRQEAQAVYQKHGSRRGAQRRRG